MKRIPVVMLAAAGALSTCALADTVYYYVPPTITYVEPAPTVTYVEPAPVATQQAIIVTAPRNADEDYLINTGWPKSVDGVGDVENLVRPMVGGS